MFNMKQKFPPRSVYPYWSKFLGTSRLSVFLSNSGGSAENNCNLLVCAILLNDSKMLNTAGQFSTVLYSIRPVHLQ
jgi:hypothetical protein